MKVYIVFESGLFVSEIVYSSLSEEKAKKYCEKKTGIIGEWVSEYKQWEYTNSSSYFHLIKEVNVTE